MSQLSESTPNGVEIAIVGMAGRFPGADGVDALWRNIRDGVESVTAFADEVLRGRGVPEDVLADPAYVKAGVVLEGMDRFDAGFFGYSPREAQQLDPQHRLFLETAWQALEHAGHAGRDRPGPVGVYAGSGASLYLMRHLLPGMDWQASGVADLLGLMNGNDKDSLATRVAYKLDLRGPALTVQTACSTSLAAVHLACRGLLNHEADLALAGGVSLNLLQDRGYRYQPGAILSPDGRCRAFDARAGGTVIGSGAGVVVLRRLADAIADGDTIHAVIRGSALNNDGAAKVGYSAPSVEGQAEVILAAQAMAEVAADSIGYVEAHGTGTTLGDPIEVAALAQAFGASTTRRAFCAIGSVKTNVGHLDAAAGVTGLIKAAMALKHRTLPPSLNFEQPNPRIDFAASPFYVNTEARPWPEAGTPRRAGVSSFGMGGTNVHVVLEEAPASAATGLPGAAPELLTLSARSPAALEQATGLLADHLDRHPEQALADVAHTLAAGRRHFEHRAAVLASSGPDAIHALRARPAASFFQGRVLSERPAVAFLFPGQGAQHAGMGRALYEGEAVFREAVDRDCAWLAPRLGLDLRQLILPARGDEPAASEQLAQTAFTQPALFVVEHAMARLWMSRGVQPEAMLGHSIGEYVAACLASVFSLEDALALVAERGRLLQGTAAGAMLAVSLPETEALACAESSGCDLAAVNAPGLCVLSGAPATIAAAEGDLAARGVTVRRLHVSHAFHSALVDPMLGAFEALLSRIALAPPRIPFVSNLSGRWITEQEACSPAYWIRHARGTVRFADGLDALLDRPDRLLLEVGPGETLSGLARRHPQVAAGRVVLASQCHPDRQQANAAQFERCRAQLWVAGIEVGKAGTVDAATAGARRRLPLPTYPFERQSYWVAASEGAAVPGPASPAGPRSPADWLYVPGWKRTEATAGPRPADAGITGMDGCVLVLGDATALSAALVERLQAQGRCVVWVERGPGLARLDDRRWTVRLGERSDAEALLRAVRIEHGPVAAISYLWTVDPEGAMPSPDEALERSFHGLLAWVQALGDLGAVDGQPVVSITVVANQLEDVGGTDVLHPHKAVLHGLCKVAPQEYPNLSCRVIDIGAVGMVDAAGAGRAASQIAAEMSGPVQGQTVAYRGRQRWLKVYEPVHRAPPDVPVLRRHGVYLVTGGLGGIGMELARHLAAQWQARLLLAGRNPLSERGERQVSELEGLGAQVAVLQCDVSDSAQAQAAVAAAQERFGALHGVFHAAGVAGGGMIAQRGRAAVEEVFAPKIQGSLNLLAALRDAPVDFVMLFSSLTAITGGFGQSDYCAANAFLDALATRAAQEACGGPVLSVNWDAWRGVGMAAAQRLPEGAGIALETLGPLLNALLSGTSAAQTLVSTLALEEQFARTRSSAGLADQLLPEAAAVAGGHPRPALSTPYAEPATELEQGLAGLWSEFLGIAPIGADDSLFELGGDSLLAIQLLAKVRSRYGTELHPAAFFKSPTVATLARLVESWLIEELEQAEAVAGAAHPSTAPV
ncbi:MAG: SDR family NAD(P)-dependent oxidoreductase [Comamonas sp.]